MLGISRWTEKDGSYRTVQRIFTSNLLRMNRLVKFVQTHSCFCQKLSLFAFIRVYLQAPHWFNLTHVYFKSAD